VAIGLAAAAVLLPDLVGLDRRLPFLAAVAWRPQAVVGAAAGAAVLSAWRPARPTAAAVAGVVAAGSVATAARLGRRPARAAGGPHDITLLCLNVFGGRADAHDLAALVRREVPDLVVLPEAGCRYRDTVTPLVADLGYRGWAATPPGTADGRGVVVLAGPGAGEVRVGAERELYYRSLRVEGGILGGRTLLAVHVTAPRGRRLAASWCRDLDRLARWTRADPAPIVVGDLNATLDHGPLRRALGGCTSVATGVAGLAGTFPASLPRWFGIRIDHVLVPAGSLGRSVTLHDVAGTDHRAVVARVALPAVAGPGGTRG
jgi:endonuclease/exonuclease/phosphatase (EEP) superfamily protein YafD